YKVIQNDGEEINLFADTYFSVVEYETKPYMLFHFHDVIQLVNNQINSSEYIRNIEMNQGEEYQKLLKEKETAEEKNKLKSNFLAAMSHELRTPLNSILGFTELLIEETKSAPEFNEKLNFIFNEGKRLVLLINDILDFSKISDTKLSLHYEFFSIDDLVLKLKNLFESRCKDKNIDFKIITEPEMPKFVNGDFLRILQILINLIGNSLKFTPSGYIAIQFSYDLKNCIWKIIVKDTGIGIPEESQKKIFSPFEQTDGNIHKKYGGTGLGLSITLNLVKLMKGNIFIESKLNEGTVFIIKLPIVFKRSYDEAYVSSLGPSTIDNLEIDELSAREDIKIFSEKIKNINNNAASEVSESKKILIVDDNPQILKLLSFILMKAGCNVIKASNGLEALMILEHTQDVQLVFMDLMMPEIDGITAVRNIRNNAKFKDVSVIAVSAKNICRKEILDNGFNDFIKKPFSRADIINALKSYMPNYDEIKLPENNFEESEKKEIKKMPDAVELNKSGDPEKEVFFEKNDLDDGSAKNTCDSELFFKKLNVAVAEDDVISQRFISLLFKKFCNISLTICDSGEELIEKNKTEKYDLIFSDMHLKGITGLAAAKILRDKMNVVTPIIALTGSSDSEEFNHDEIKKYFCEWLQKPVSLKDIETIIKKYS
ncbi:response regulator, partial [Candidatus Dependentiae bacterium]|nr:response regulator [Candidatus Dependentiae bacterium]